MVLCFHIRISGNKQQQLKWLLPHMMAELKQMQILHKWLHYHDSDINNGLQSFSLRVCDTSVGLQQTPVLSVTAPHRDQAQVYLTSASAADGKGEPNRGKLQYFAIRINQLYDGKCTLFPAMFIC